MNATLEKRLTRLKGVSTRYELAAEGPAGKFLMVYTSQRSLPGLVKAVRARYVDGSLAKLADPESTNLLRAKRARDGATFGEYRIYFTGRTQREAYLGGELVFLPEVK